MNESHKTTAQTWFNDLREQICTAFESIEDDLTGDYSNREPGRFERTLGSDRRTKTAVTAAVASCRS
jgi:coproporphyrinogen III oxidase